MVCETEQQAVAVALAAYQEADTEAAYAEYQAMAAYGVLLGAYMALDQCMMLPPLGPMMATEQRKKDSATLKMQERLLADWPKFCGWVERLLKVE